MQRKFGAPLTVIVVMICATLFLCPTQLLAESGVLQEGPLQFRLEGLTRSPAVVMTTGSLGGWNEDDWVPFRLNITNTDGSDNVAEAAVNLEHENAGSYGIDAFAACFSESAGCGSGRTPTVGPSVVGSGSLWRLLVDSSEQMPMVSFYSLPGGVRTIQWRLGGTVPAGGSLIIRWAIHLAKGGSTNLACTGGTPLGSCSPQTIPPGKGEASWPGRSLQVRTAPPIPGERTVSIDVAQRPGCVVATAAYGSSMASEVAYMHHVRDEMIGSSKVGEMLVAGWNAFYYSWSPPVADLITKNDQMKPIFQFILIPLVGTIHLAAWIYDIFTWVDASLASVISFLTAAFISLVSYVIMPFWTLIYINRRRVKKVKTDI